jgi:hypothetical protein
MSNEKTLTEQHHEVVNRSAELESAHWTGTRFWRLR